MAGNAIDISDLNFVALNAEKVEQKHDLAQRFGHDRKADLLYVGSIDLGSIPLMVSLLENKAFFTRHFYQVLTQEK